MKFVSVFLLLVNFAYAGNTCTSIMYGKHSLEDVKRFTASSCEEAMAECKKSATQKWDFCRLESEMMSCATANTLAFTYPIDNVGNAVHYPNSLEDAFKDSILFQHVGVLESYICDVGDYNDIQKLADKLGVKECRSKYLGSRNIGCWPFNEIADEEIQPRRTTNFTAEVAVTWISGTNADVACQNAKKEIDKRSIKSCNKYYRPMTTAMLSQRSFQSGNGQWFCNMRSEVSCQRSKSQSTFHASAQAPSADEACHDAKESVRQDATHFCQNSGLNLKSLEINSVNRSSKAGVWTCKAVMLASCEE